MKKITVFLILLILAGCNLPQKKLDEDFIGSDSVSKEESAAAKLLSVKSVDDARIKARKAIQENNVDLAQAYYVKAYGMEPENISLLEEMAQLYKRINNNELVEFCYQLILKQDPNHFKTLEQYGLLLIKLKKYPEAEEKLLHVLDTNKEDKSWVALNGLGLVSDLQDDHEQAISFFKQALEIKPNQIDVLNNIGYTLYRNERYIEAIDFYKQALAINPNYDKTLFNYALLEAKIKNYDLALNIFSKLMSPAEANNNVGYIAMKNGDLVPAKYFLNQANTLSTRFYDKAHENLQFLKTLH